MANLLESIGRTNTLSSTTKDVAGFFGDLRRMKQEDVEAPMRMGLLQNQMETSRQQIEINKFNIEKAQREQAEFDKRMPVEMFRVGFQETGQFDHALNVARSLGYINSDDPNDPYIKQGHLPEVMKILGNDENRTAMAQIGKNAAIQRKNTLAQQIMEYQNQAGNKDLATDKKYLELTGAYQKAVEGYQIASETFNLVTAESQKKLAEAKEKEGTKEFIADKNTDEQAFALYGKPFGKLTQSEQQEVLKKQSRGIGRKTYGENYREWENTFTAAMGRKPTKEEIRKKLIADPWGMLSPEEDTQSDGDVRQRFQNDSQMKDYTLGNKTPNGFEVLDSKGTLMGYYE